MSDIRPIHNGVTQIETELGTEGQKWTGNVENRQSKRQLMSAYSAPTHQVHTSRPGLVNLISCNGPYPKKGREASGGALWQCYRVGEEQRKGNCMMRACKLIEERKSEPICEKMRVNGTFG